MCCFLEQETFLPKVLVIPRNRWLRLNMTGKLFTGTLNHNQNKKSSYNIIYYYFRYTSTCDTTRAPMSRDGSSGYCSLFLYTALHHGSASCSSVMTTTMSTLIVSETVMKVNISYIMRKLAFCILENKGADQLRGNHAADLRLCFCCIDSTIPLLP